MQPGRSKCDKGSDDEGRQNVLLKDLQIKIASMYHNAIR